MLQVIVQRVSARVKRSSVDFSKPILDYSNANCKDSPDCYYITAQLPNEDDNFEVGNGQTYYRKYKNVGLEPATKYNIYIRGISYNSAKVSVGIT